jgi:hypothetical protein
VGTQNPEDRMRNTVAVSTCMRGHYTERRPISPKGEQNLAQDLNPGLNLGVTTVQKRTPSPFLPVFRVPPSVF